MTRNRPDHTRYLAVNVDTLLKGDMAKVLSVLRYGLASSEHGDFVERLIEI